MFAKLNKRNWIKAAAVLLLLLAVAPLVLAEGEDELVIIFGPANDDFADAEQLVFNKDHRTSGLLFFASTESLEGTDPDLTSCSMLRTVWYRFVAPFDGRISLSTRGSYIGLSGGGYSQDTKIAVYTGTALSNLTQVACNDNHSELVAELEDLSLSEGTTYYVRVGIPTHFPYTVFGGYYVLSTSILSAVWYDPVGLVNGNFSSPITTGWTLTDAFNGDGIESGAFKFYGSLFESTRLVQKRMWPTSVLLGRLYHLFEMDVDVTTVGTPNLKIVLALIYSDGTPNSKRVFKVTSATSAVVELGVFFTSPNVSKVKVGFINKAAGGTTTIDNIKLDYDGGILRGEALPLPLP